MKDIKTEILIDVFNAIEDLLTRPLSDMTRIKERLEYTRTNENYNLVKSKVDGSTIFDIHKHVAIELARRYSKRIYATKKFTKQVFSIGRSSGKSRTAYRKLCEEFLEGYQPDLKRDKDWTPYTDKLKPDK